MQKKFNILIFFISINLLSYPQSELPYTSKMYHIVQLFWKKNSNYSIIPIYSDTILGNKTTLFKFLGGVSSKFQKYNKPLHYSTVGILYQKTIKKFFFEGRPYFYLGSYTNKSYIPEYYTRFYLTSSNNFFVLPDFRWKILYAPKYFINFSVGKGKMFLGNGYRSFFLSDNGGPYNYLRGQVRIWHIKYVWQVAGGYDKDSIFFGHNKRNYKYFALHFLEWNIKKWLSLQLFETVIWPSKNEYGKRGLELDYLNPIIFYRPLEFDIGSGDNVIMGGALKISVSKINFYSQFMLDEFRVKEFMSQSGWWGNKYSIQVGLKYKSKKSFLLTEFNFARPFIYSHRLVLSNYGIENQPLAHPLGAAFAEFLIYGGYKLTKNKVISLYADIYRQMLNTTDKNYGSDIYIPYNYLREEYGYYMFSGKNITVSNIYLKLITFLDKEMLEYFYITLGMQNSFTNTITKLRNSPYFEIGIKSSIF